MATDKAYDAIDVFNNAVSKICGRHPSLQQRQNAISIVVRRHPELHSAYLAATNHEKGGAIARQIEEKAEKESALRAKFAAVTN
jgi:hypothetical protein